MNRKMFLLGGLLALVGLAGCEGDRSKPSAVYSRTEVRAVPRERRLDQAEILAQAAAQPASPFAGEGWQALFDGATLTGWKATPFAGAGEVQVQKGLITFSMGDPFTGIQRTNEPPSMNYEIALDALRVTGSDFFCGLTFPVRDSHCSLILGGWGGSLVGISSLDGMDASENETSQYVSFETGKWYRVRVRVTERKLEAWIEQKKVVDVGIAGRKISLRPGDIEMSRPLGIASWMTGAAFRDIKWRPVAAPDTPVP